MSGNLKKRWTLPDSVVTHIFTGEPSGNTFAGFHSEADKSLDNGDMVIVGQPNPEQMRRRDEGKIYKLKVKIKFNGAFCATGAVSTFFPNPQKPHGQRWTKENIVRWIEQGLTDPNDSVRSSRAAWESQPRGQRGSGVVGQAVTKIRVNGISCNVLYQNGVVASIYPAGLDFAPI